MGELSEEGMLVSTNEVLGQLARWAVRQSPYPAPDNMADAMAEFASAFPFCPELSLGDFRIKRWTSFEELHGAIWTAIESSPAVVAWNSPRSGHDAPFVFSSRYDRPSPDDDFIDLHALCGNVARAVWREAAEEAERDDAMHGGE